MVQLYTTHIPLRTWQKAAVALASGIGALQRPARADLVGTFGETTGGFAFKGMLKRMQVSEEGRLILADKPRVDNYLLQQAREQPQGSFGAKYAEFMDSRGFRAEDRPCVRFLEDPELAYVATRAREVHDFWHVLFGCSTTVFGELALKSVEFVQTGMPMTGFAVLGAQFKLNRQQQQRLWGEYIPWAVRIGSSCEDLICIYYEQHLTENLEQLRKRWKIVPAPLQE
eukprot:TRINITY_DN12126_c0_g2_i1.p4 TRINITY_DN12126_c0_g2~~TRINITY_DN12126_c0_g2_i1.p4  ORF type:complete len:227 (+),score=20.60 TRINITY_DN12126_c0_g2_i1:204-884(+)